MSAFALLEDLIRDVDWAPIALTRQQMRERLTAIEEAVRELEADKAELESDLLDCENALAEDEE